MRGVAGFLAGLGGTLEDAGVLASGLGSVDVVFLGVDDGVDDGVADLVGGRIPDFIDLA